MGESRRRRKCPTCQQFVGKDGECNHEGLLGTVVYGEPWHGTVGGYNNHGCRQRCCSEAKRRYGARKYQERTAKGLPPGDHRHGTLNGYNNYGCRCPKCQSALRARQTA